MHTTCSEFCLLKGIFMFIVMLLYLFWSHMAEVGNFLFDAPVYWVFRATDDDVRGQAEAPKFAYRRLCRFCFVFASRPGL